MALSWYIVVIVVILSILAFIGLIYCCKVYCRTIEDQTTDSITVARTEVNQLRTNHSGSVTMSMPLPAHDFSRSHSTSPYPSSTSVYPPKPPPVGFGYPSEIPQPNMRDTTHFTNRYGFSSPRGETSCPYPPETSTFSAQAAPYPLPRRKPYPPNPEHFSSVPVITSMMMPMPMPSASRAPYPPDPDTCGMPLPNSRRVVSYPPASAPSSNQHSREPQPPSYAEAVRHRAPS